MAQHSIPDWSWKHLAFHGTILAMLFAAAFLGVLFPVGAVGIAAVDGTLHGELIMNAWVISFVGATIFGSIFWAVYW